MAFGRPMHTGYAVIRILELKLETTQPYLAKKLKDFWNQKQILAVKNGGKQREGNKKKQRKNKEENNEENERRRDDIRNWNSKKRHGKNW